ncbi:helix-turn-helix domain protein [Thermaerobacter marianensis DSM 12885]|uniref:Helix-turn-helix domain protein n=1 Tax=Thermaerobacter marianensis (strain ATCC 700841 / DSM 12885 / JCM 10246 / 7p75a) TaxID=644966 RepID=E6SJX0_THEM7|nr:helix-turn-helix transcriptional regulator [Thermaerobacter marianensis]ADU52203.1 helix-turn-helix domain protein [Thermaerobacter marianensis DSM 12885]
MDLVRIGDKVIDRQRIYRMVDRILELRASGLSQQDVAQELGIDRTLVSRLESLGEVRRGRKLGLVGFPVGNRQALEEVARSEGVDFVWLLTEEERRRFIGERSGAALLNDLMLLIARARELDHLIFLGSDMRIRLVEALLGPDRVTGIQIGTSPITEDRFVDPEQIRRLIRHLRVPRDEGRPPRDGAATRAVQDGDGAAGGDSSRGGASVAGGASSRDGSPAGASAP